jgi:phage shock protein PspC (stress-responsive transcriptional regulator)
VAGVAAGLAEHLGLPVLAVRIALVVLLGFSGLGLLLYAAFWAVLPQQQLAATDDPPRRDFAMLLPFAAIGLGVILLQALVFRDNVAGTVGWLVAVIAVGAGIIWHQSDPTRRGQLGLRGGPPATAP